jgi:hypothetical protein
LRLSSFSISLRTLFWALMYVLSFSGWLGSLLLAALWNSFFAFLRSDLASFILV